MTERHTTPGCSEAPAFHVEECNALGRALPKLYKSISSAPPKSPEWDEAYHVSAVAAIRWHKLRSMIAVECEPWFSGEAFR